ncbi:hypothetical protein MNBD_PLANCTO02-2909 [hydrothermal vent metagenome]|uniref:Uncharacterized protein n=1 Tax=hydrothermal vent metagenome TaxID=652676 RepID=A0A3B1DCW2_9ZZZZ
MTFTFKPTIDNGVLLQELPRPILRLSVQDAWDFEQFKVPMKDGDTLVGHSQKGIEISIDGQVGTQAGTPTLTEEAMFTALESLRAVADVADSNSKYDFFLYYDVATSTYRKFKSCSTVRFEYDISDNTLFTYSLVIHAEDPAIYSTASGA